MSTGILCVCFIQLLPHLKLPKLKIMRALNSFCGRFFAPTKNIVVRKLMIYNVRVRATKRETLRLQLRHRHRHRHRHRFCTPHSSVSASPQAAQPSEQLVQIFHTYQQTVWKVCNGRRCRRRRCWGLPSTLGTFLKIYDAAYAYRS